MIYTVTVNPAIDYIMRLPKFDAGLVNRAQKTEMLAGGKGINVSQILNQLNIENEAWGFLGGFPGQMIEQQLKEKSIREHFTRIFNQTRINVKLKADLESEINGPGPELRPDEIEAFEAQFSQLTSDDIVVLSGSIMPSLPADYYHHLIELIKQAGADFVIDTTGKALEDALAFHPLVIKPNHHELAALFNTTFANDDELLNCGQKLLEMGAQNVLISMAEKGAYLLTPKARYYSKAPKGTAVNSVGAGDSMLAGFTGMFHETKNPVEAFRYGLASGSATAFTADIANRNQIDALLPQIVINELH